MLTLLSEKTFDLAILDIRLPDGSTLELVREIESLGPKPPIIIMTASRDDNNIAEFLSAGVNAYLTKPIDVENLFNLVDQYKLFRCRQRRMTDFYLIIPRSFSQ